MPSTLPVCCRRRQTRNFKRCWQLLNGLLLKAKCCCCTMQQNGKCHGRLRQKNSRKNTAAKRRGTPLRTLLLPMPCAIFSLPAWPSAAAYMTKKWLTRAIAYRKALACGRIAVIRVTGQRALTLFSPSKSRKAKNYRVSRKRGTAEFPAFGCVLSMPLAVWSAAG